ncbi:hypothetical protein ABZ605_27865 [Streptomyces sp. NPDC012765]|uniref:hypothetical protein n=1 Tax=Streptomyces sp. NPDC012765 TaxID=3155249 RepID=UPI0033D8A740
MTAYSIAPLRIPYAGRIFDSQTEARWAVFFDVLGVHWTAQPKIPRLPEIPRGLGPSRTQMFDAMDYTPDFYLPTIDTWVEVKATEAQLNYRRARELAFRTAWHTGLPMLILGDLYNLDPPPEPPADWAWVEISPQRWTRAERDAPLAPRTRRLRAVEKHGVLGRRVTFHRYPDEQQMTVAEKSAATLDQLPWTSPHSVPVSTGNTHRVTKAYRAAQDSFRGSRHPAPGVEPGRMQV